MSWIKKLLGLLMMLVAFASAVMGVMTLLPVSLLPWHVTKPSYLGYVAHCPFAPISTAIMFALAAVFFFIGWRMIKR